MKRNLKFFTIVISVLLLSAIILTGCMCAIAADNGEMKTYDLNRQNSHSSGGNIVEDAPTAQDSLQTKFEEMYDISEDGKTITVISKDYLSNYWQSNNEKEVIKSLTTEEVYFIIQDSIRIYEEYDKVLLPGFDSISSIPFVTMQFPFFVNDDIITTKSMDIQYYHEEDIHGIYAIIMYRLTALSSPKAFFTGAEAIRFNGRDPMSYNSQYPETVFYIPGYSETTDRDYILSMHGGKTDFADPDRYSDLFWVSDGNKGKSVIEFSSKSNNRTRVYPTVEMENKYSGFYTTTPGGYEYDNNGKQPVEKVYGPFFILNRSLNGNSGFTLSLDSSMSGAISGHYMKMDNKLLLVCGKGSTNYSFVFYYQEGEGYRYSKEESVPPSGYDFEDGTMFYFDMKPQQSVSYIATREGNAFWLDYDTGKFGMYSDTTSSTYFIRGKFDEYNGVLKLYPENAGDPDVYSYVFHQYNDFYVYSAADSKPLELAGFTFKEGLVFKRLIKGVSTEPETDPPVNNTQPE